MISLIGLTFLCLSILINLLLIFSYYFKYLNFNNLIFYTLSRISTFSILLSFFSLILAYVYSDFTNYNVFQNSHSTKPLLYKITGTWGNHEGSMLMWLSIMSLYNFLFSFINLTDEKFKQSTIITQHILYLFFAFFVLFLSNPFLINPINVNEGLGLNPILQDPSLAIHPPILYLGYLGYSIIFSLSIVGLLQKKINSEWLKIVKKLSLFCWSMLTCGIALGSFWAYYELGWGGWWFWDPVENVSLMPWIAGLALVHSLLITKDEQVLKRWIVFLSILCFALSIFGTFLVRSGILTSVHSFASDPQRGLFILLIFFLITGFSFLIFIIKLPSDEKPLNLLFINKVSALIFNNIVMIIACLTILLGTIYPIIIEVITNERVSVGEPYFNSTVIPIILPALLLMSIAPALSWRSNKINKSKNYLFFFLFTSLLVLIFSILTSFNPWVFIGLLTGVWIILASTISIILNHKFKFSFIYLKSVNSYLAHIGVGILILGITISSIFQIESTVNLEEGDIVEISNIKINFDEIEISQKPNHEALRLHFRIIKNDKNLALIEAGKNYYYVSKTITTEAGIFHDWLRDIYIVVGDKFNNSWNIKIYNNPLVSLIWVGVLIMVFTGLIGIIKK